MSTLVILTGNIGTGKTTFRKKLEQKDRGRVIICPDEYEGTQMEKERKVLIEIMKGFDSNKTIIMDGPNVMRIDRSSFLELAKRNKYKTIIFDFGQGNEESLKRRIISNSELSAEEWKEVHKRNHMLYQQPEYSYDSCDKIIRVREEKENNCKRFEFMEETYKSDTFIEGI